MGSRHAFVAVAVAASPEILPLVAGASRAGSDVTISRRHDTGLTLEFALSGLEQDRRTTAGTEFTELAIADGGFRGAEGQAALPTITRLVAVPDGLGVQVRVTGRDLRSLGAMTLAPVQPIIDQGKAAPAVDAAWYASAPASEPEVSVGEPALLHGDLAAGRHEVTWQGRDDDGDGVASGTYFYRLEADTGSLVRNMLLLK